MMRYVWVRYLLADEYDPSDIYSELDEKGLEVRKVEFYKNGLCFSYGDERGNIEALSAEPFPQDLRTLNLTGEREAQDITCRFFQEIWNQAQERPDGFMGMFY